MGNSSAIVARVLGAGPIEDFDVGVSNGDGNGWPTYWSSAGDPAFIIHCTASYGRCSLEGRRVRIPAGARPEGPTDAHMTVVDQRDGWEYDFWQVRDDAIPARGGRLDISWGGRLKINGDGVGTGDANAANTGLLGGLIRAEEIAAGRIDHAMFMTVRCDSGKRVFPATGSGQSCAEVGSSNANAAPEGARFWLDVSDAQIQALDEPAWKKTILTAMAHYGLIVGDTGAGTWGLRKESGRTYTSFGVTDKWLTLSRLWGLPYYQPDDDYVWRLQDGTISGLFARYLRVLDPCVSRGSCG